jgi:hypothetical protein
MYVTNLFCAARYIVFLVGLYIPVRIAGYVIAKDSPVQRRQESDGIHRRNLLLNIPKC